MVTLITFETKQKHAANREKERHTSCFDVLQIILKI